MQLTDRSWLEYRYRHAAFERRVRVSADRPAQVAAGELVFALELDAHEEWTVTLTVTPRSPRRAGDVQRACAPARQFEELQAESQARSWTTGSRCAPKLETDDPRRSCAPTARA